MTLAREHQAIWEAIILVCAILEVALLHLALALKYFKVFFCYMIANHRGNKILAPEQLQLWQSLSSWDWVTYVCVFIGGSLLGKLDLIDVKPKLPWRLLLHQAKQRVAFSKKKQKQGGNPTVASANKEQKSQSTELLAFLVKPACWYRKMSLEMLTAIWRMLRLWINVDLIKEGKKAADKIIPWLDQSFWSCSNFS